MLLVLWLRFTPAASTGVVAGTLPAVSVLVAVLLLRERSDRQLAAAIILTSAGVVAVTVLGGGGAFGRCWRETLGTAHVLAAVVCEGVFLLPNERLQRPLAPLAMSAAMTTPGLVLALFERPWAEPWDGTGVLAVICYALVPTVGGFLLWYTGAARLTGMQATLTTALLPVSAVLLSALLLGEPVGGLQIAGMACVVGAVLAGALRTTER